MTHAALELALYDLSVKRESRAAYAKDPDGTLGRYRLDAHECALIRSCDVAALQRLGVSALLTMGFWMTNAPTRTLDAYLARLRGEPDHG